MARFSADGLDLSRFSAPLAIRGIDFEAILAERKERLLELYGAAGIDYDVGNLETDPAIILQEADAYHELLTLARVNDAVRSVMVAFAVGSDLDHLAAFYGVSRMSGETDTAFRRRVLIAPEAFGSAGAHGAYVFHALSADVTIANVDVWSPAPGRVVAAVQASTGNGIPSTALIEKTRARLLRPDIKPLTDMVIVQPVQNVNYSIDVDIFVLPGPDPLMVRAEVLASLEAMTKGRRTPSRDVPRSAVYAAASVGPVDKVIVRSPAQDVAMERGQVAICTGIDVRVQTYDG